MRIHGSPLALSKVDEIVDHIAGDRPMAAERIIYRVDDGSVLILTVRHGRRPLDLEEIEGRGGCVGGGRGVGSAVLGGVGLPVVPLRKRSWGALGGKLLIADGV